MLFQIAAKLIEETKQREEPSNGTAVAANGTHNGKPARKGVAAGSFLHQMMKATNKTTGDHFTQMEIATQVTIVLKMWPSC